MTIKVTWIDSQREPQVPFNRDWPYGVCADIAQGKPACVTELQWPAPRCGAFYVECDICGTNALITTAGRVDDPRSVKLPCDKGNIH